MSWWHPLIAKDHPAWHLLDQGLKLAALALFFAYWGADSLDVKDFAAVLGGAVGGRLLGRS